MAAGDVDGEAAEVLQRAALGELARRRVRAERGDVAHVDDAVDQEGHGAVEQGQGEQHAYGVYERPPAARRGCGHRRGGQPPSATVCRDS